MRGQKQTNQDRIAELKKSGSSANEDEITSLERQNALLQAQIALKEKLEEDQRVAAAKDAYKALSKKFYVSTGDAYAAGAGIATATGVSYYAAAGEVVAIPVTESKDIVDLTADDISRYDELQQKYNDATDALADYNKKKEDGVTLSKDEEKDFENLTKQAESYQAQMDNLDGRIDKNKDSAPQSHLHNQYFPFFFLRVLSVCFSTVNFPNL